MTAKEASQSSDFYVGMINGEPVVLTLAKREKLPYQPATILSTALCSQGDYYNELLIEEGTSTKDADAVKSSFGAEIDQHIATHTLVEETDIMYFSHEILSGDEVAVLDPNGILGPPNNDLLPDENIG